MEDTRPKVIKIIAIGVLIVFNLILSSCKNKNRPVPSSRNSPKPVPINEVESKNIISDEDWLEQWTKESQMNQIQTATKSNEIRDEFLNSKYPEVAKVAQEKVRQLRQAEAETKRIAQEEKVKQLRQAEAEAEIKRIAQEEKMRQLRQAEAETKRIAQERRALLEQVNRTAVPEQKVKTEKVTATVELANPEEFRVNVDLQEHLVYLKLLRDRQERKERNTNKRR